MGVTKRKIDFIDKMTLPVFAATMVWEHRVLKKRQLRELVDVDAVAPVDDGGKTEHHGDDLLDAIFK